MLGCEATRRHLIARCCGPRTRQVSRNVSPEIQSWPWLLRRHAVGVKVYARATVMRPIDWIWFEWIDYIRLHYRFHLRPWWLSLLVLCNPWPMWSRVAGDATDLRLGRIICKLLSVFAMCAQEQNNSSKAIPRHTRAKITLQYIDLALVLCRRV